MNGRDSYGVPAGFAGISSGTYANFGNLFRGRIGTVDSGFLRQRQLGLGCWAVVVIYQFSTAVYERNGEGESNRLKSAPSS